MPRNVLPLPIKETFLPIIWIFTEGEGIESRLPYRIFSPSLWQFQIFFQYNLWINLWIFKKIVLANSCADCRQISRGRHSFVKVFSVKEFIDPLSFYSVLSKIKGEQKSSNFRGQGAVMQMRGGGMWQNLKVPRNFSFSIWNKFEFVAKFANCSLLFTVLEIKDFFRFYSGFNTASNFFWTNVTILWGGPHGIGKGPISLDWQWRKLQPSNQLLFMTKHIVKFNTSYQYCYMWR